METSGLEERKWGGDVEEGCGKVAYEGWSLVLEDEREARRERGRGGGTRCGASNGGKREAERKGEGGTRPNLQTRATRRARGPEEDRARPGGGARRR